MNPVRKMAWIGVLLGLALEIAPLQGNPSGDKGCFNDWKSRNHRENNPKTCQRYIEEKWCTEEGALGPRWNNEWGSFTDWADANGNTALVCPQCGCGKEKNVGKLLKDANGQEYRLIEGEFTEREASNVCRYLGRAAGGAVGGHWYKASLLTNDVYGEIAGKVQNLLSGSTCAESWVGLGWDGAWYWTRGSGDARIVSSDDKRWAAGEPKTKGNAYDVFIRFDHQGSQMGQLMTSERPSWRSSKKGSKRCSVLCDKSAYY